MVTSIATIWSEKMLVVVERHKDCGTARVGNGVKELFGAQKGVCWGVARGDVQHGNDRAEHSERGARRRAK
jgi:hypothetical protein